VITRDLGDGGWAAGCQHNPPPLHVYDTESIAANWYPYERPAIFPTPGGPGHVFTIPTGVYGDDPLDPTQQTKPRFATMGMIGRFHAAGTAGA
jgi:hypothetical protein